MGNQMDEDNTRPPAGDTGGGDSREAVTGSRRTGEAFHDSEQRYRSLVDNALIGIYQTTLGGKLLYANEALARIFEFATPEEMMAQGVVPRYVDPGSRQEFLARVKESGRVTNVELHLVTRTGRQRNVLISAVLEGDVLSGMIMDITERKQMMDQLSEAKIEWENTFNTINDAITIHDADFNVIRANQAAVELLGASLPEIFGRKCFASYHGASCPPEGCPSCRTLETGKATVAELFEPHLNRFIEIKALPRLNREGRVIGLVHIVRDITGRKKAEEEQQQLHSQFIQSQKMESIGRLAGGIAHDFNNILSAILGYSELLLLKLPSEHPLRDYVRIIKESGVRAAELTHQLLAFSRKQVLEMKAMSVSRTVENMVKMLTRIIGEDISLELRVDLRIRNVLADQGQIEQILMNLAVNARDAMPAGGRLIIGTADVDITEEKADLLQAPPPGTYVLLSVADTGEGMSSELQKRIFEPFFTTKAMGKGTGLGLATVYGIVKQHNGYIYVFSEPGQGSRFEIYLPTTVEELRKRPEGEAADLQRGHENILVVEDEPSILTFITELLSSLGYRVLAAPDAEEALRLNNAFEGDIHLLLTDIVMPGINGRGLSERIRAGRPAMKVVLMSGYTDDVAPVHEAIAEGAAFIRKPLTPGLIARKIREVLDK